MVKRKKQNVHKLSRIGPRSLGVTLPAEFLDSLGWREKQKLRIKRVRAGMLITDWPRPKKSKKR